MPLVKPSKITKLSKFLGKTGAFRSFLACFTLLGLIFLVTDNSRQRLEKRKNEKNAIQPPDSLNLDKLSQNHSAQKSSLKKIESKEVYDEWCMARDYKDLSNHPSLGLFNDWVESYILLKCAEDENCSTHVHDFRKVRRFYEQGIELATERRAVLEQIIRGDPKRALELALDETTVSMLPNAMQSLLEKWVYDYVDFQAMHVCYDSAHPTGLIKKHVTFSNGDRFRAWTYGRRNKMPSTRGLAAWGIRLGEDFAMADLAYRELQSKSGQKFIQLGDNKIPYLHDYEKDFFVSEISHVERYKGKSRGLTMRYPKIASSLGLTEYYERKYDFNSTRLTWEEANQSAKDGGGRLVSIESQQEQTFLFQKLREIGINGFDEIGNQVSYAWIGATDDPSQYAREWNATTKSYILSPIGASEGDWRWLWQGGQISSGYQNWHTGGAGPSNTTHNGQDYGVLNWGHTDGHWLDVNAGFKLPFIVEYDDTAEPATLSVAVNGYRKVLVIPARFQDEGYNYDGSSVPVVDQFGEPLFPDLQNDSFEPVSSKDLEETMQEVKDFFLRNSDNSFYLEPVISPTVTMQLDKFEKIRGSGENIFDTGGEFWTFREMQPAWEALGELDIEALIRAAELGDDYHFGGPAFQGLLRFDFASPLQTSFAKPPVITLVGGNINPATNRPHENFKVGQAEAIVDENGRLISITILDPGAYYYSEPTIFLDGQNFSDQIDIIIDDICVSYVIVTTHGGGGLGYVGGPGSHVTVSAAPDPTTENAMKFVVGSGLIVHELGHNFNQHHSNTYTSLSERPNSDEVLKFEYNHPHSVMGSEQNVVNSGDFTIIGKVSSKIDQNFGLTFGNSVGDDVAWLEDRTTLDASPFAVEEVGKPDNTFRIFRHNWAHAPVQLLEGSSFPVELPSDARSDLEKLDQTLFSVAFRGTGYGASGTLDLNSNLLTIVEGGLGYGDNPIVEVLNESNQTVATLDPKWIRVKMGTDNDQTAVLRNLSEASPRGLRGIALPASQFGARGLQNFGFLFDAYWLEYRTNLSPYGNISEEGLWISLGTNPDAGFAMDDALLDMQMHTPDIFTDAMLLPGNTYSDYDSDVHITPLAKGGTSPMNYMDVVINMGSVASGEAQAPLFTVDISNQFPKVSEFVGISIVPQIGKTTDYAYAWFTDEMPETSPTYLNKSTISKSFSKAGEYTMRVLVSDFKGGLSSRNIVFKVGDYHKASTSSVSGIVYSPNGRIQGARVEVTPSPNVEHQVDVLGNEENYFLPNGTGEGLSYRMDGMASKDLFLRRGEKHKFIFDITTEGFPLSFFTSPDPELPNFRTKMKVTPMISDEGNKKANSYRTKDRVYQTTTVGNLTPSEQIRDWIRTSDGDYTKPPEVRVEETGAFANYMDHELGTIADYQAGRMGNPNQKLVVQRPYAKALLHDTMVDRVLTRPQNIDAETGEHIRFGGKGLSRTNPPEAYIMRSSFWEDFFNDQNASLLPFVDGVGTISPVNSISMANDEYNFLKQTWYPDNAGDPIPDILVWGTSSSREYDNETGSYSPISNVIAQVVTEPTDVSARRIVVSDQGRGWEPNSTMAVLHYPIKPFAYWTFDLHESLFDDGTQARYQPSPGWNRFPELELGILSRWTFDELSGDTYYQYDKIGNQQPGGDINMSSATGNPAFSLRDNTLWEWGVLGRAAKLSVDTNIVISNVLHADANFTFSAWLKPDGDFTLDIGGHTLTYDHGLTQIQDGSNNILRLSPTNQWMHVALVATSRTSSTLYLDGQKIELTTSFNVGGNLEFNNFSGLLDEVRYYQSVKEEYEVKELAGRTFLDLSGNKFHAVPISSDSSILPMSNPSADENDLTRDLGLSTDRPGGGVLPEENNPVPLGDSFPGENHGRSISWENGQEHHIDISTHRLEFASLSMGTLAFWVRTDSVTDDVPIFCASDKDDNKSFFRIKIRQGLILQAEVYNDEDEVSKFYTTGTVKQNQWTHVAYVADLNESRFYIDGVRNEFLGASTEDDAGNARGFFSDIENINFIAIGKHQTSDSAETKYFSGKIDDFYVYDRPLTDGEILYLMNLKQGRVSLPRLEPVIDSVGTIIVENQGEGYKETPDTSFSYGQDGNETSDLELYTSLAQPFHGDLRFWTENNIVVAYHHGGGSLSDNQRWRVTRDKINNTYITAPADKSGWRPYERPVGETELVEAGLDRVLWTQDTRQNNVLELPDGRTIIRRYVEYVVEGKNPAHILAPIVSPNNHLPNHNFSAPTGLYGYSSNPKLSVPGDAKLYSLMYTDPDESPLILTSGRGLVKSKWDDVNTPSNVYRIFGRGYQPQQGKTEYYSATNAGGKIFVEGNLSIEVIEQNAENVTQTGGKIAQGFNNEFFFQNYSHRPFLPEESTLLKRGEPRNLLLDVNKTVSHISLQNPGFGYSVPVEVKLIGGYPNVEDLVAHVENFGTNYLFTPAAVSVATINDEGAILTFQIDQAGAGYIRAPEVVITGGGGSAALATATIGALGEIVSVEIFGDNHGRGYFNIDPANTPTATLAHQTAMDGQELDATLKARLGGSLASVNPANNYYPTSDLPPNDTPNQNPWIEIWDLERDESYIDEQGFRALAVPKVTNGVIEDIVVVKSGKGYRDPVVFVRGGAPEDGVNHPVCQGRRHRLWRCMNERETLAGEMEICGHIEWGLYPPENCPGEVPVNNNAEMIEDANVSEERTAEVKFNWLAGHLNARHKLPINNHCYSEKGPFPAPPALTWGPYAGEPVGWEASKPTGFAAYRGPDHFDCNEWSQYPCASHLGMSFKSRRCSGRKSNFKLLNDPYRSPYEIWDSFEAKLVPLVENGQIISIVVEDGGNMYAADEVAVSGTGGSVEVLPVFGSNGNFIQDTESDLPNYIFYDQRVKNIELDIIQDPIGAGHGFAERTWSRDGFWLDNETPPGSYKFIDNVPTRSFGWKGELVSMHGWVPVDGVLNLRSPELLDNLGDRLIGVSVLEPGIFADTRTIEGLGVSVGFSVPGNLPDLNGDGQQDFVQAVANAHETYRLTGIKLDDNSTYLTSGYKFWEAGGAYNGGELVYGNVENTYNSHWYEANGSISTTDNDDLSDNSWWIPIKVPMWQSLWEEEPRVHSIPDNELVEPLEPLDLIRLNGKVDYDADLGKTYLEFYVDDNFPNEFYYGYGNTNYVSNPRMGGKIYVTEGMPGMNFDITPSDSAVVRGFTSFTDQNGFYSIPDLDFGIYNVSVYMEDHFLQESTFRPESNATHVSETVYVAGMPTLTLVSNQFGPAKSKMEWSLESRRLGRPGTKMKLEGIGAGFKYGSTTPELFITPGPENKGTNLPKLDVTINLDGSLNLELIYDGETTTFNSEDTFTVNYSSASSGVNFREDFQFGDSENSSWGGSYAAPDAGSSKLIIFPNDGDGASFVEVPLSTATFGDKSQPFYAVAYDENGLVLDTDNVTWELRFDFDSAEAVNSRMANLSTTDGNSTDLTVRSSFRRGLIEKINLLTKGVNYNAGSRVRAIGQGQGFVGTTVVDSNGGIIAVEITDHGSGYEDGVKFVIDDPAGEGASLSPVLGGGKFRLHASMNVGTGLIEDEIMILSSLRQQMTLQEKWLDKYLDTIDLSIRDNIWWIQDLDGDGLDNNEEFILDTNPLDDDTDDDGMTDSEETGENVRYKTNPRVADTDGDGLSDFDENATYGSNPLLLDTDKDGYSDAEEVALNTSLLQVTKLSNLSGIIYKGGNFEGKLVLHLLRSNDSSSDEIIVYDTQIENLPVDSPTYPYFFKFDNLLRNKLYRVVAFIDSNENDEFDSSEMYAQWEGNLTQNISSPKLTLKDIPPTIEFEDTISGIQKIDRGESFILNVMARDFPDDNWTITSAVEPREILISGSAIDQGAVDVVEDLVTVRTDAEFGNYEIEIRAKDITGSISDKIIREIEVVDMRNPTITLLVGSGDDEQETYKWRLGEEWNAEALKNKAFIAQDFPSGIDLTNQVEISGTVDANTLGVYEVKLSVSDESGRIGSKTLLVEVTDQTPPEITFLNDAPLVRLIGTEFSLPPNIVAVSDNLDGDLTSEVQILDEEDLDPSKTTTQYITFEVVDSTGNIATAKLEILFEEPGFSISGIAIDGYLIGSQITFVPKSADLQYLTRTVSTNEDGSFDLDFLASEFQALDANKNGVIDLEEASIQASGGIDSTTNREFTGILKADPQATILSPLTTIVHAIMEEKGSSKEEALAITANAFGYPAEIDVTNFDPINAAASGDEDSKKILQSAALVANMMKQAEVFSDIANVDTQDGEAALAMANDLADLATQNVSLIPLLAQSEEVKNTINRSLQTLDSQVALVDSDLEQFSSIASASNLAIADSSLLTLEPGIMAGRLANRQIAVEEEVLVELEEIASGTASLTGLATTIATNELLKVADALPAFNQFAPTGTSFDVFMTQDLLRDDFLVNTLSVEDADGDAVTITLGSGNLDVDGDGVPPLSVNESLELRVSDAFDLLQLSDGDFDLSIILTDAGGKSTTIFAHFKAVGENLQPIAVSLFQATEDLGQSWYNSTWFGNFYAIQNEWFYHDKLGWLYLIPNANGGFWCWDIFYNSWWWSNAEIFPYAYLMSKQEDQSGWLYFDFKSNKFRTYEFPNQQWTKR